MTPASLKRPPRFAPALLANTPAAAHLGGLDASGKDATPNPDIDAPVKKSREDICHDFSSPNYRSIRYFISYRDMCACLESGGRAVQ